MSHISEVSLKGRKRRNVLIGKVSPIISESENRRLPILVDRRSFKLIGPGSIYKKDLAIKNKHRNISMCSISNGVLPSNRQKPSKRNIATLKYRKHCNKKNQLTMEVISPDVYYSTTKMGAESPKSPIK